MLKRLNEKYSFTHYSSTFALEESDEPRDQLEIWQLSFKGSGDTVRPIDDQNVISTDNEYQTQTQSHANTHIFTQVSYSSEASKFVNSWVTSLTQSQTTSLDDHPSTDRNVSWVMTVFSILGMLQGSSVLAMPFVVSRGGIGVLLSTIFIGVATCYTCLALIDCQYQESKSRPGVWKRIYTTYIEIGTAALPTCIGGKVMTLFTLSSLLTDVYAFILIGQATKDLIKDGLKLSNIEYTLIWGLVLYPILFITRVSVLAWFMAATLSLFTVVTTIIYVYLFFNLNNLNMENLNQPFSFEYLLIGYGVILNSFNFHWVVPAVEGSMKTPGKANSAFITATVLSIVLKFSITFLSATILGLAVQQSITSNLITNNYVSIGVNSILLLSIYLYLPMSMFVISEMFDLYVLPHFTLFSNMGISFRIWQLLSRLLVLLSVLFVAVSTPQFGLVISVVGSIRGTIVALVLPMYCHLKLKWKSLGVVKKGFEIVVIIITSLMSVAGTYYSVKEIFRGEK